jgi:uncharacterized membrane protein
MTHQHPVNKQMIDQRSRVDGAVDRFVAYFGSVKYLMWQSVFVAIWCLLNGVALFGLHWDPYPFILLNLIFSTQASYAAPLVLLSQNRAAEHDRLKAEHDYQVNEDALSEIRSNTALTRQIHAAIQAEGLPQVIADLAEIVRAARAHDATTTDREAAST